MKKLAVLIFALACSLPGLAQTDIDGTRLTDELRVSTDGQVYSDGRNSAIGTIQETHRYSDKFAVQYLINGGEYFSEPLAGGGLNFLIQPNRTSYFEAGAVVNSHTNTYQTWNVLLEAGTQVYKGDGFVKGAELDYSQTFRGFGIVPSTKIFIYNPRLIFYLPKDWQLALNAGAVDVYTSQHNFEPLGGAKLRIPVTSKLNLSAIAGWDSEGITDIQQVQSLSTRNYGGSVEYWFTPKLSIGATGLTSLYSVNHLSGNIYSINLTKRW